MSSSSRAVSKPSSHTVSQTGRGKKASTGSRGKQGAKNAAPKGKAARRLTKSVASEYPKVARQWNSQKNQGLTATMVPPASRKKVWWKCSAGHEWEAVVYSRTLNGTGCPYCSGKKAGADNNLKKLFPKVAKEWHAEKNAPLTPDKVTKGSKRKVWWKCAKGHEWQAPVYDRTNGKGCPYCAHRKLTKDNSLKAVHPAIAAQWNHKKNGALTPDKVFPAAGIKVWWKCKKGHEWEATINSRTTLKTGCPYCSGHKIPLEKSLFTTHKSLVRQWDKAANGDLSPKDVSALSKKMVFWKDTKGNTFQMSVRDRTLKGKGFKDIA
ncbi:MAG: zinc-ribbon domain-containing protein [Spirochaetales bacterium]|nr:zinc-ribbon domain-containing protein [Spirochaetales bacterium]